MRSAPARLSVAAIPAQPLLGDVFGVGIGLVALVVAATLRAPPVALLAPALALLLAVLVTLVALPVSTTLLPLLLAVLPSVLVALVLPALLPLLLLVFLPLPELLAVELLATAVLLPAGVLLLARAAGFAAAFEAPVLTVVTATPLAPTPRSLVAGLLVLPVLTPSSLVLPVLALLVLTVLLMVALLSLVLAVLLMLPVLSLVLTVSLALLTVLLILVVLSLMLTVLLTLVLLTLLALLVAAGLGLPLDLLAALACGVAALLLGPVALLAGGVTLGRLVALTLASQVTARLVDVVAAPVTLAGIGLFARLVAQLSLAGVDLAVVAPRSVALVLVALPPGLAALVRRAALVVLPATLLALVALPFASSVVRIGLLSVRVLVVGSVVVVLVVCHGWCLVGMGRRWQSLVAPRRVRPEGDGGLKRRSPFTRGRPDRTRPPRVIREYAARPRVRVDSAPGSTPHS